MQTKDEAMLINKPYEIDLEFKDKGHNRVMNVRYDRRTELTSIPS